MLRNFQITSNILLHKMFLLWWNLTLRIFPSTCAGKRLISMQCFSIIGCCVSGSSCSRWASLSIHPIPKYFAITSVLWYVWVSPPFIAHQRNRAIHSLTLGSRKALLGGWINAAEIIFMGNFTFTAYKIQSFGVFSFTWQTPMPLFTPNFILDLFSIWPKCCSITWLADLIFILCRDVL